MPIGSRPEVLELSAYFAATRGLLCACLPVSQLDLFLDGADRFGRNLDEFNTYSHSGKAVTDLASAANLDPRQGETELNDQNSALGKLAAGVDEHPARTDVWRARDDVLAESFISDGKFAETGKPRSDPVAFQFFAWPLPFFAALIPRALLAQPSNGRQIANARRHPSFRRNRGRKQKQEKVRDGMQRSTNH